ncbi:MAG: glycosyltransferase [Candidatus Brocadiia bacterium]
MNGTRKTTVLFAPEGTVLAHVGRVLAVAQAMPSEEVEMLFAGSGCHSRWMEDYAGEVLPLYTRPREQLMERLLSGGSAFDYEQVRRYVEDEIRLLREVQPDVVVGDFRPTLGISARYVGIKHVCLVNAVWSPYCAVELAPPDSWLPTRLFGKKLISALRPLVEKAVFAHYARPFNRVLRRYGLPEAGEVRDCMCSGDLNLLTDLPEFCPTTELPPDHRYAGPISWEPDVPEPDWLDQIPADRPTVYLTMGSTGAAGRMEAISERLLRAGYRVICTSAADRRDLWPDEPAFHAVRYAPGSALCRRADVVVCHGGNGTIYQALAQGTPVVGVPQFHDQEFNMQRVEELGVGLRARLGWQTARGVCQAVTRVLVDEQYTVAAMRFRRLLSEVDGAGTAAAEVLRFAGAAAPGQPVSAGAGAGVR